MPNSKAEQEFVSHVLDLMSSIGPIQAKRMFGGYGISLDALMFALVSGGVLYLKADDTTRADFVAQGLAPFTYTKKGKRHTIAYFQAPEEALEDGEVMNRWASSAYAVALRAAANKSA